MDQEYFNDRNRELDKLVERRANTRQVGGQHYKAEIQHWDLMAFNRVGYFEGQITKYVTRWKKKNGKEDVQKSLHYLDKLIEVLDEGILHFPYPREAKMLQEFAKENEISALERDIFFVALTYTRMDELLELRDSLRTLFRLAEAAPR